MSSICPSSTHLSSNSSDFSESGPIVTKFYIQPAGPLGTKSFSNGLGHIVT